MFLIAISDPYQAANTIKTALINMDISIDALNEFVRIGYSEFMLMKWITDINHVH